MCAGGSTVAAIVIGSSSSQTNGLKAPPEKYNRPVSAPTSTSSWTKNSPVPISLPRLSRHRVKTLNAASAAMIMAIGATGSAIPNP